ncbi:prepilin-type N-terminal cleavage/methylation domain-containing protein [Solidesulfovibrio sp.]|uniref:PulJ/GspJ family protein n=1 Tax=Solidesulfovibrio sp. TaxID=2910990 RepID=UPI002624466F|nr:prepilin-type N-terminal cleavage/methylation domain-containing protein [Solidesulfovibrio sp.]
MRRQERTHGARCAGFTLIEIVCVLVLLGLTALVSSRMFTNMIRGYVLARNSDAAVQKAQNAMQRMTIDFTYLRPNMSTGTASTLTYNMSLANTSNVTIAQSGNRITYSVNGTGYTLTDGVQANSLTFSYFNTYDSAALTSISSSTSIVGFSYTMVGDDTSQGLSQNYATRVMVNKVK